MRPSTPPHAHLSYQEHLVLAQLAAALRREDTATVQRLVAWLERAAAQRGEYGKLQLAA